MVFECVGLFEIEHVYGGGHQVSRYESECVMARVIEEMPPIERVNNGGRKSPWAKFADGKLWELSVVDDLGYPSAPTKPADYDDDVPWERYVDVKGQDEHNRACQDKAQNSARQWAKNHGMTVQVRRHGRDKVIVTFIEDPEGKLKRR